jgi:indoleacetamide hydrolase
MTSATFSNASESLQALTERLLSRAERAKALNIFIHIAREQALEHALMQDAKTPTSELPLRGLPIVVKDNIDVAGMPTTAGSPAVHHMAVRSATAIERLTQAGALVLGKVNLHELCFGITSNNAANGPVRNPYAPDRISGGSSGGTAAAIAAGLAPAGIGSDTGGSMRIPAALCGVVGMRPSTGRWPSDGVLKISDTRDTLGPMGRRVQDCALLDAVVCNEANTLETIALKGLRLGVPQALIDQGLDAGTQQAMRKLFSRLQAEGVQLITCDLGMDTAEFDHVGMVIAMYESVVCMERYFKERNMPFDGANVTSKIASPDVRGIFEHILTPGTRDEAAYKHAVNVQRPRLQQAYADCFKRHAIEAMIFPTTPLCAALIGQDDEVLLNGQSVPTFPTYTRFMATGSLAGQPGITVPMGRDAQGLPLGIALDAPAGSDRRMLAIAQAIEAVIGPVSEPIPAAQTAY